MRKRFINLKIMKENKEKIEYYALTFIHPVAIGLQKVSKV